MTGVTARLIPPHEKRILEAFVRGVALSRLALQNRPLNEYEQADLKNLIRLRMSGLPLQYLTGSQGFYGRSFYVNTSVLIPRPETEGLVELALKNMPGSNERLNVLDFGTGSGCIALTLALERPDVKVFGVDSSAEALIVAQENAKRLHASDVEFSEVAEIPSVAQFEGLPFFDMIVSNPPYLVLSDEVAQDVRENEPPEALFTPDGDPMYFYRFLAELAACRLNESGVGVFEISESRGEETAAIFSERGFETAVAQDLAGRERYLTISAPRGA